MNLLTAKLLSMLGSGLLALFFGLLPLKVKKLILKGDEDSKKMKRREFIISGLLCVGAGVLVATVFIHMLPETREGFKKAEKLGYFGGGHAHVEDGTQLELAQLPQKKDEVLNKLNQENKTQHDHAHPNVKENEVHNHHDGHDHPHHDGHDHPHPHVEEHDTNSHHGEHDHPHPHVEEHDPNSHNNEHDHPHNDGHDHPHNDGHDHPHPHEEKHDNNSHHGEHDHPHPHPPAEERATPLHQDDHDHPHPHEEDTHSHHDGHDHPHPHPPTGNGRSAIDSRTLQESPIIKVLKPIDSKLNDLHNHHEHEGDHGHVVDNQNKTKDENTRDHDVHDHHEHNHEAHEHNHSGAEHHAHHNENEVTPDHSESNTGTPVLINIPADTRTENPLGGSVFPDNEPIDENTISPFEITLSPSELELPIKLQSKRNAHHLEHFHEHDEHTHNHDDHHKDHQHDSGDHGGHDHTKEPHEDHASHSYPFAELTICAGFFLIYLIEETVHKIFFGHSKEGSSGHSHSHVPKVKVTNKVKPEYETTNIALSSSGASSPSSLQGIDNPVFSGPVDGTDWSPRVKNHILSNSKVLTISDDVSTVTAASSSILNSAPSRVIKKKRPNAVLATIQNLLIVAAIGFHAIFEGMAVGLQESVDDVWYLTFAISAHTPAVMFCVGLELLKDDTSKLQMILSTVVLSLITPLGTAIGIIVTENSESGGSGMVLVVPILQGLAGGTLLYVAFLEILERERSKNGGRFLKFFSFLFGFAFMCCLEAFGGHSH